MSDTNNTVRVTFRPLKSSIPAAVRIRQLLKHALRSLDLKCERVEDVTPTNAQENNHAN